MTYATAGLISYSSISYMLAKLSEILIHRLGSPKFGGRDIYRCSGLFANMKNFMLTVRRAGTN